MMGMAAAVLLSSCVKDTLYDTPHPDYGKIAVTADWSARGEGIDIPATWTVTMGDYTGTETSATHAPEHLFAPSNYTLAVWNPAEGITVNGTTATIAAVTENWVNTGVFVNNAPGWFFTYTEQVTIEKDKDYPLTAAMKQQVRELTLLIKPTGDAAGRITEIVAYLTGQPEHSTSPPIPTEPLQASCCPSPRLPRGTMPASGKPRCGCWV